jgi:hypothetical protein
MGVQCCKSVVHGVIGTVHKDGVGHRASVVFGLRFIPLFAVVVPFHQEGIFGGQPGEKMSTLHGQPPFKRRLTGVVGFQVTAAAATVMQLFMKGAVGKKFTGHFRLPSHCRST